MEEVILEARIRDKKGKSGAEAVRREGFIPAVLYGAGKDSQSIKLSRHDFLHFLHQHRLESTVVNLKIKEQKPRTVLVKDVQYHPVKEDIIHIDFQEISLTSKIKVNVEIKAKGEPVGVKQEGGTLNHILWELEVECLPTRIPHEIQVDVSQMKIGEFIHVKDLHLPEGVVPINDPDSLVFSVEAPRKEEEVVAPAAEGEELPEPEVIKEKKEAPEEVEKKKEEKEEKG